LIIRAGAKNELGGCFMAAGFHGLGWKGENRPASGENEKEFFHGEP
jgi:hypothetical protein